MCTVKIIGTSDPRYMNWLGSVGSKINGAYLYAKEIEENILPAIKDRLEKGTIVNTVAIILQHPDEIENGTIVVAHDNLDTVDRYRAYFGKRIKWICSLESTRDKLLEAGEFAIYVPLSVDLRYLDKFKTKKKPNDTAFFGNLWLFKKDSVDKLIEKGVTVYGSMERDIALSEIATYKKVYAEGRCAIEAQYLGCKILKIDYGDRFDSQIPKVYDNRDLLDEWTEALKPIKAPFKVTFTADIYPYCVGDKAVFTTEEFDDYARLAKIRRKTHWCKIEGY